MMRELEVTLTAEEFYAYNWALALERPALPFLLYTTAFLLLAGLVGLWPGAQLYALAAAVPLAGYALLVQLGARRLWHRHPEIAGPRRYRFDAEGYAVVQKQVQRRVRYDELRLLESRSALYLIGPSGADILPKRLLDEELSAQLQRAVSHYRRSRWL